MPIDMTIYDFCSRACRRRPTLAIASLGILLWQAGAQAQSPLARTVTVSAVIGSHVKVSFDRSSVVLDSQATTDTLPPVQAAPLTVTAKARVAGNDRIVLTVQADGAFVSGTDTIPENMLSWTATGTGFRPGTANANAAKMLGSWRGSGVWTGSQTYTFQDSWAYFAGVYALTMTYTLSAP